MAQMNHFSLARHLRLGRGNRRAIQRKSFSLIKVLFRTLAVQASVIVCLYLAIFSAPTAAYATEPIPPGPPPPPPPNADFEFEQQNQTPPSFVQFTDRSTPGDPADPILFRVWTFGDNKGSFEKDPLHKYEKPGDFTASLTVFTWSAASDSTSRQIHVDPWPAATLPAPNGKYPIKNEKTSTTPTFRVDNVADKGVTEVTVSDKQPTSLVGATLNDSSSCVLDITSSVHLTSLPVPHLVLDEGTTYYWAARFFDNNGNVSEWSDVYSFTTLTTTDDQNGNGIPDSQENYRVDLDGD
jgi:PKD repeat protein